MAAADNDNNCATLVAATALLEKLAAATKAATQANRYEGCPVWALNDDTERAYLTRAMHAAYRDRTADILKACADEGIVFPEGFDYRDLVTYIDVAVGDGAEEWAEEFAAELAALKVAAAKALDAEVDALQAEINRLNSKLGKLRWDRDRAWDAADGVVPTGIPRDMTYLYEIHDRKD